ncbi:enoyl-CoA delta isomerase 1, mitochondrial-like isoform X2 [Neoarius graeffei]|uniref:enoyl-CoA delta isomerase 1, mitochondrial-like isoform X2 n=1 Tax=Neoarius graeffei TaxID=443677 RepID=UPI00298BEC77|nr:enoyl-CoA delta isomerase 1, mitochondrial-like isoform X2 [Neoarius graeffei]
MGQKEKENQPKNCKKKKKKLLLTEEQKERKREQEKRRWETVKSSLSEEDRENKRERERERRRNSSLSEEKRARKREKERERRRNMSEEEKKRRRDKEKERRRNMSEEERERRREKDRERWRNMSEEERERRRVTKRERERRRSQCGVVSAANCCLLKQTAADNFGQEDDGPQKRRKETCTTTSEQLRTERLSSASGIAVVKFQNPPVNSMSLDFLTEFSISLEKLELDKSCRGVIFTSAQPKVFSAGLDILEMYGKNPEHYAEFWKSVQDMWLKLYGYRKITIAAINGSSPAGGCLLSLSCDYRIMAADPHYRIGLNETQLGIVAPFWFKDTMVNTVGHRTTELSLQFGLMYSPSDALKIGLVDQLVPEENLISTATETMTKWFAVPDHAREISKSMMRKPTLDRLLASREADTKNFVNFISKDSIQKSLGLYLTMLKQRKA